MLISCCSLAIVFIIVKTCYVGYVLFHCEGDIYLVQRRSCNASFHSGWSCNDCISVGYSFVVY